MGKIKYVCLMVGFVFILCPSIRVVADTNHLGADWSPGGGFISGRHYNIGTYWDIYN